MEQDTTDNGVSSQAKEMAGVSRFGLMEACMKAIGRETRLMGKEGSFMQMEMFIRVTGLMIRLKGTEFTLI